ncbi:hypothetical protein THI4931_43360 [Pandoraea sputorum]|nr:hypothetical protein THI4931_43360 [Pandoraea sputorum]
MKPYGINPCGLGAGIYLDRNVLVTLLASSTLPIATQDTINAMPALCRRFDLKASKVPAINNIALGTSRCHGCP